MNSCSRIFLRRRFTIRVTYSYGDIPLKGSDSFYEVISSSKSRAVTCFEFLKAIRRDLIDDFEFSIIREEVEEDNDEVYRNNEYDIFKSKDFDKYFRCRERDDRVIIK